MTQTPTVAEEALANATNDASLARSIARSAEIEADIAITPGINNPTAIEAALEHGITTVKYFPAEASGGLKMLKALLAPYAMLQVMPTGGIGTHNIRDYLALKNVIACGGSWMVEKTLLDAQNWEEIARLAREAVALVQGD